MNLSSSVGLGFAAPQCLAKIRFVSAAILAIGLSQVTTANAIVFDTFVSSSELSPVLSNNATIGFTYAGNKFVGSVYFGSNNNQLYQTDLNGNNVQKFGAPIPGAGGEIYVSSSLGLGGFGKGDVFAAQGSGIYRISNDGTTGGNFVSGLSGGVRGIAFDPYGVYGNDMLVTTTSGSIYRVNSSGAASLLANVGADTEGLDFTPQAFGAFATGTLVVASEGSGKLTAIKANGDKNDLGLLIPGAIEMLSFVPLNLGISGNPLEGFYAASYPNDIQHAGASAFVPYKGDAIVTAESSHQVYQIHWNGTTFDVNNIGVFPGQPEDGIFVTAEIIKPGCRETNTCGGGGGEIPEPGALAMLGLGLMLITRRKIGSNQI